MSRDLARYARSGAWSIIAEGMHLVGGIVLSVVVVRSLSTRDFGILSEARQITSLAVVLAGLALERAALRFVPELVERQGAASVARFFWRTMAVRVGAWAVTFLLAIAGGSALERLFHVPIAGLAAVGVATGLCFSFHNHVRACATARFATRAVALASAAGSLSTLVVTVVLLEQGYGVAGVLWAAGGGMLLAGVLMLRPALATGSTTPTVPQSDHAGSSAREAVTRERLVRFTAPFAGIALLNFLVHSETEVLFLGHFHGPDLAGFFKLGFTFAQRLIDFLPLALWEVSMAGFSRIAVQQPQRLPDAVHAYLTLLYLAIAPLVCLGVAFSPAAIRMLYGSAMEPAALVSQAYFLMAGFAAMGAPIGMIVYARERVGAALRAYLLFATVNVVVDLALIPRLGLWGGIIGLASAKLLSVLLLSRLAWQEIPALRVPWRLIAKAFLASTPALLWLLVDERFASPLETALGGLAALLAVLLAYRLLRVVGEGERGLIAQTRLPMRGLALAVLSRSTQGRTAP